MSYLYIGRNGEDLTAEEARRSDAVAKAWRLSNLAQARWIRTGNWVHAQQSILWRERFETLEGDYWLWLQLHTVETP